MPHIDRRLAEYLLARIASGEYPVGGRIPSLRRLGQKFHMPHSTVHLQLRPLLASGILKAEANRGIVVGTNRFFPQQPSSRKLAALIESEVLGERTSISYVALLAFQQLAISEGFEVSIHPVHHQGLTPEVLARATRDCLGTALFKEYDAVLAEFDSPLPTVATLMTDSYGGRISLVNLDEFQAAELAGAYFRERNVSRVEVIGHASPIYRRRAEIFQSYWRRGGGECDIYIAPHIRNRLYPEVGYLFTSDTMLRHYHVEYQQRCGRNLNEDFIILGMDGKRRLNPDWPLFPSVSANWREIGETMFRELRRRMAAPHLPGRRILLGGELFLVSDQTETAAAPGFAAVPLRTFDCSDSFDIGSVVFHQSTTV